MPFRLCVLSLMLLVPSGMDAADFPQFRGPIGNGVLTQGEPPTSWSNTQNLAWMTKVPGTGWSQPIIIGNKLFITAAVGEKLSRPKDMQEGVKDMSSMPFFGGRKPEGMVQWQLIALNADSGSVLWTKTIVEGKPQFAIHPSNTYATETPCADGERVYSYFGATGTLAAYTHTGEQRWKVELGAFPFSNGFGSGSSPLLIDGKIIISNFNEKDAFLAAFDAKTGKEIWREKRAKSGSAWASPMIWKNSKRTEIVAAGDKLVTSHDPATGKEFWRLGGIDTAFAPSPAIDGDMLLLAASSPFSASPLYGVKSGATGDITLAKGTKSNEFVAWSRNGSGVGMSSPLAHQGYLYIAGDGQLICDDIATGKQIYKERLPKSRSVTACLMLVGEKLLILDETGKATWVKTGPKFEVIDQGTIKDTFWASPAIVGDKVYLRGVDGIYCLQKQ
jgi:outer membrane protein assembly factor BamB